MKIVFAGPSLSKSQIASGTIEFRGPAFQRDVFKAVQDGANVIGIIDGFFESVSSVWHKEILYALSQGVHVLGAASMGALRAAECAEFGMIGVGKIFDAYVEGRLLADSDVKPASIPINHRPPFRFEAGHDSSQLSAGFRL